MHAVDWLACIDDLSQESGERWVAAALAEAAALRGHDDRLFPDIADAAGTAAAKVLRDTWRRWADDAEALLKRLTLHGPRSAAVDQLDYEVGRVRAMLRLTPERTQRARRQADEGATFTSEEVRRELGIPARR